IGKGSRDAAASENADAGEHDEHDAEVADAGSGLDNPDAAERDGSAADAEVLDAGEDAGRDAEVQGCGDGKLQSGEVCDDKNNSAGDGCSADCKTVEQDFLCPAPGEACVSTVKCGDGRVSGREQCDDMNRANGDGCNRDCEIEPGWKC